MFVGQVFTIPLYIFEHRGDWRQERRRYTLLPLLITNIYISFWYIIVILGSHHSYSTSSHYNISSFEMFFFLGGYFLFKDSLVYNPLCYPGSLAHPHPPLNNELQATSQVLGLNLTCSLWYLVCISITYVKF